MCTMYKAIVIDDEKMSCEFVSRYISTHKLGFEVVESFIDSQEALEYIKTNDIDLVITDIKMPHLDGLELIKIIYEIKPKLKIIIMSGYADFDYAKTAIKYDVCDYILKPIDVDELENSLTKLKVIFDEDEVKQEENFENTENFFSMLLNAKIMEKEAIEEEMKKINFPEIIDKTHGEIYEVNFLNFEDYSAENWKYGKKGLINAIINILNLHFHYNYVYCISENTGFFTLIVFFTENDDSVPNSEIIAVYKKYINVDLRILKRVAFENIYEIPRKMSLSEIYNANFDNLTEALIVGKKEEAKHEINLFLKEEYDFSEIANQINRRFKARNIAISLTKDDFAEENYIDILLDKISKLNENDLKIKMKQYIEKNYMLDITREDVANAMYISPSYFSVYFKSVMGKSFRDYLLSVRMEKAKLLLLEENKPQVVSKLVGYNEFRYFKKNFFEYTGCYPNEYQKKVLVNRGKK